jgi:hypothetical protein
MGLHADIHQARLEVTIALHGEFRKGEFDQLRAILSHFRRRGCRTFIVDFSRAAPLGPGVQRSLRNLFGHAGLPPARTLSNCAIRLSAETPAARPQTGCGEPIFSVAS